MRTAISTVLAAAILTTACVRNPPADPADMVLLNGGIYTVDDKRSWAEAAATGITVSLTPFCPSRPP